MSISIKTLRRLNAGMTILLVFNMLFSPIFPAATALAAAPGPQHSVARAPNAVLLHAAKRDSLQNDVNGNGLVEAGDTLRYTVVVSNTGDMPALNTLFTDTLSTDLALVPGSLQASPLAYDLAITVTEDISAALVLQAFDPNGDPLSYFTLSGPANGGLSGTAPGLTYTPAADYAGPDSFTFQVCDTAAPPMCDSAVVTINVSPVNDPPVIATQSFILPENRPNATNVGVVAFTDPDAGQSHTFAILSGNTGGAFDINPATGMLSVADTTAIDYETNNVFTITVGVSDDYLPPASGSGLVRINITDANDAPVVNDAAFNLAENTPLATAVGAALSVTDQDAGQTHTWSILAGNTGGGFSIDAAGQIRVAAPAALDFETTPVFTLTVQVTDQGPPAPLNLADTAQVVISLSDVNDAPVINDTVLSVFEGSPNNTLVGQAAVSDQDAAQTHTFAILNGNTGGAFSINNSGQIRVADTNAIDFETLNVYTLTVQVTDVGAPLPNLSDTALVRIDVDNANDVPVVNPGVTDLDENSPAGTQVFTVTFTDPDVGQLHTFSITGGAGSGAFAIDPNSGIISVADSAPLDFETTPVFTLTVRVTDNGAPPLFGEADIRINLRDANEAPIVDPQTASISENSPVDTLVGTPVTYNDELIQSHVFSITAGNTLGAFKIDAATGQVSVANPAALDFEATPVFTLTVRVTDNGTPQQFGQAAFIVNLVNVNEAPLVAAASFGLDENSANGTAVGTVLVNEPDAGQTHTWSILSGNTGGAFAINAGSGQLTVNDHTALDFETTPVFTLTVQATDNGTPPLSGSNQVVISLNDANDAPVVNNVTFNLDENASVGTPVGSISFSDPDAGQTHTFAILSGNTGGAFSVNSAGQILTDGAINFEVTPAYTLTVQVIDNGSPALSGLGTVKVLIADLNEAPVVSAASFSIPENASNGTVVGVVNVADPDAGQSHTWSILSGNTSLAFNINSTTGQLTVANSAALDFETTPVFTLTVQAVDNGSPALSDSGQVRIELADANDPPMVYGNTFSLDENSAYSTTVGVPITFTDSDLGQAHSFAITAGNIGGAFSIDPLTGQIYVQTSAAVDFETTPTFNLTVQVSDNGVPMLSDTATVTINLVDKNDAPEAPDKTFSLPENSAVGAVVGTATFTDPDSGQTHTWSILSGNAAGAFALNGSTGQVTVASSTPLDFETTPVFTLTVQVVDNGVPNLSGTAKLRIDLTNVNETPAMSDQAFDVDENSPNGTVVDTVIAADPDAGEVLTFSIIAGNTGGAFAISSAGGMLTVANMIMLDYETTPAFTLTVKVTDAGGLFTTADVRIDLNDVDEAPIVVGEGYDTIGNTQLEVDNTSLLPDPTLFVSGNLLSNDSDPEGTALTASLENANGATVTVDGDGSFIYTPPAGQFNTTHTFTYRVTDAGGKFAIGTVTITIVNARVWYVKNNAAAGGLGRSSDPFDTLAEAQAASAAGDTIYIFTGSGATTGQDSGIVLQANQRLIGQGVALTMPVSVNGSSNPITLLAAGSMPKIENNVAGGHGVTAANPGAVEIRGLNIAANAQAIRLTTSAANAAAAVIDNVTVRYAGAGGVYIASNSSADLSVALNTVNVIAVGDGITALKGSTGQVYITQFRDLTVSGDTGGMGITVNGAIFDAAPGAGYDNVDANNISIGSAGNGVGSNAFYLNNVQGKLSTADLKAYASTGTALFITGVGSNMTFTANGAANIAHGYAGPGMDLNAVTAAWQGTLHSANGSMGMALTNVVSSGVSADSSSSITGSTSHGVYISGGQGNVTYAGAITNSMGRSVTISNRSTGVASVIAFTGSVTNNPAGTGIFLDNNDVTTINFSGGLSINSGSNPAFTASNGGTVSVSGANNTLNTTSGTALKVTDTTIGAAGMTFMSVSSSGAANGIYLSNTGTAGGLTVTGAGSAGSGGTLLDSTASAVYLNNTQTVSLTYMNITNGSAHGIEGVSVNGFTLNNSVLSNVGGGGNYYGLFLTNPTGSVSLNTDTIQQSAARNAYIKLTSGTLASLSVTNSSFLDVRRPAGSAEADNFFLDLAPGGSGVVTGATFSGNVFNGDATLANAPSNALLIYAQGSGAINDLRINNNTSQDNNVGFNLATSETGHIKFSMRDNSKIWAGTSPINLYATGSSTLEGYVLNNSVKTQDLSFNNVAVFGVTDTNGKLIVNIGNNTINNFTQYGIRLDARGDGTTGGSRVDAVVVNNTIQTSVPSSASSSYGVAVGNRNVPAGQNVTFCLQLSGNTAGYTGTPAAWNAYQLVRPTLAGRPNAFYVQGVSPSPATNTETAAFLGGANSGTPVTVSAGSAPYDKYTNVTCTAPNITAFEPGARLAVETGALKVLYSLMPDRAQRFDAAPAAPADGETINLPIGHLPAGKQVVIRFDAVINPSLPSGVLQVANQGYVSADGLGLVLTDDPDTAAPDDPTVTLVYRAPLAADDGPFFTDEDTPFALPAPGVLANDQPATGYSLVVGTWTNPSVGGALAGQSDGGFIFTPTLNFNGQAVFSYRASDGASLSAPAVVTVTVQPVNDAPVLDNSGDLRLNPILVNQFNNPGTLLSDILASDGGAPISDVDAGALTGIAVTAVNNSGGVWQFTTDGSTWIDLSPVSPAAARLLAVDANTAIRFVPDPLFNGAVDPGITFQAWDQTTGSAGGTGDATVNGGVTAFSTAGETARIFVNNQADLSLLKGVSVSSPLAGVQVQYTFTVTNAGPSEATGVTISDTLPLQVSYLSGQSGCSLSSGKVTCLVGNLSSGASVVKIITVTLNSSASGLVNNTAEIWANEPDLNPVDNRASAAMNAQSSSLVYFNDFETAAGGEWNTPTVVTPVCGSRFLGEFGNQSAILTLNNLPEHTKLLVAFDLYTLRSWNGNLSIHKQERGPDYFRFDVDGLRLINTTFSNNPAQIIDQAYPAQYGMGEFPGQTGAMAVNTLCYTFNGRPMDATYHLVQAVSHQGSTLTLDFSGFNLQELTNESWGLDNVAVYISSGSLPGLRILLPVVRK